ncbi:helix-turn-helix domain-containing protein [Methylophaga thalassica]|uniref:helix-turn-helix domain-containing protein n=1 Tax=Methylophaga aminisulfidivorans TaxID=230105 RepID=UPI003A955D81
MKIGDVAKITNLPTSTIRYYEEKGLIQSTGRKGLTRTFSHDVLERLALITLGQNAGLSLDEIRSMLLPDTVDIDRELLLKRASELDEKIKQMTAMRDGLRHAAACKAANHLECKTFRRLLNIATKRLGRPKA